MADSYFEPGSFRDRTNRVFYQDGVALRGLDSHAVQEWEALSSKPFFQHFIAAGKLVQTEQVEFDIRLFPLLQSIRVAFQAEQTAGMR